MKNISSIQGFALILSLEMKSKCDDEKLSHLIVDITIDRSLPVKDTVGKYIENKNINRLPHFGLGTRIA